MSEWTISRLFIGAAAESVNAISMENAQGYAAITGDNNPLHFDTEEAYRSRYGKPIAHGMRVAAEGLGPPYPRPRAYRRPARLAKGAQLCYNVKNNRYGGNRIWSF